MRIDGDELGRLASDAGARPPWGDAVAVLVVDLDADAPSEHPLPPGFPAVVVGTSADPAVAPRRCDLVVAPDGGGVERVVGTVAAHPVASLTIAGLLRVADGLDVDAGLMLESACYGALQAGAEFRRWRSSRPVGAVPPSDEPVLATRDGDVLHLTLHRPGRRNALDAAMRDALAEQLALVASDATIRRVVLDGDGPSFCSGGDLDEFGTAHDPSVAHLVRQERSLGRAIHAVRDRVEVRLRGACIGSGIELAAFATSVRAAPDVTIGLPEVSMGLIPGAGGTVSLTRRIGRHRTCRLALTGERIDANTALSWGLVDGIDEVSAPPLSRGRSERSLIEP